MRVRECGSAGVRAGFVAIVLTARIAGAQVGHPPASSPFLDFENRHEITVLGGWFSAKKDPAKVAPQTGAMAGLQYEWRASGPVHLAFDLMAVNSKRTELDPSRPIATRVTGTNTEMLYAGSGSLNISLTGERSWHGLMPMVGAGLGIVTTARSADIGGFKFGTRFAFPWGAGVRWIPGGGPLQIRADVKDWMYTIRYPQAYYTPGVTGDEPILAAGTPTSRWTNNFAMSVGLSYTFKR